MKYTRVALGFFFGILFTINSVAALNLQRDTIPAIQNLKGEWHFQLDPLNKGIKEEWFSKKQTNKINLPATTDTEQKGELNTKSESGRFTRVRPYYGPAWYQKEIEIPAKWAGKEMFFFYGADKVFNSLDRY